MKRLNKLYRGKNYATDILSFEAPEEGTLGELVLCLPTIRSQARRTGLGEKGELGYASARRVALVGVRSRKKGR